MRAAGPRPSLPNGRRPTCSASLKQLKSPASLTSMMSTTGDRSVGQPNLAAIGGLGAPPDDRQGFIDWQVRAFRVVGSPGFEFDEAGVARPGRRTAVPDRHVRPIFTRTLGWTVRLRT